jgi:hypothetical protein
MKKLIISLFVCFSYIASNAQIIFHDVVNDSILVRISGMTVCRSFTDRQVLSVGVKQIACPTDTLYYVVAVINQMSFGEVAENGRMLIRLQNNDVIQLKNYDTKTIKEIYGEGTRTTLHHVGNTTYATTRESGYKINCNIAMFPIDESDLKKLFIGVKKIKIEMTNKNYEKEFSKDKIGSALCKHYNELKRDMFAEDF